MASHGKGVKTPGDRESKFSYRIPYLSVQEAAGKRLVRTKSLGIRNISYSSANMVKCECPTANLGSLHLGGDQRQITHGLVAVLLCFDVVVSFLRGILERVAAFFRWLT